LHPAHVAGVVTTANEHREHQLLEHGRMEIGCQPGRDEARLQITWHDQESESQRGKQSLAERPDVDDTTVRIERMQARQRLALIASVTVIVVFHDPRVRSSRPSEQFMPARKAHRQAERKLTRRSHVCDARIARAICIDDHPFFIDRHRHHGALAAARAPRAPV
jgi:hypothetical protein